MGWPYPTTNFRLASIPPVTWPTTTTRCPGASTVGSTRAPALITMVDPGREAVGDRARSRNVHRVHGPDIARPCWDIGLGMLGFR
jgi:hypothetical protein